MGNRYKLGNTLRTALTAAVGTVPFLLLPDTHCTAARGPRSTTRLGFADSSSLTIYSHDAITFFSNSANRGTIAEYVACRSASGVAAMLT